MDKPKKRRFDPPAVVHARKRANSSYERRRRERERERWWRMNRPYKGTRCPP